MSHHEKELSQNRPRMKCPKCRLTFRYQESLERHVRNDHHEAYCFSCASNQHHRRLAPGETYTCGFKPYRHEEYKYSTVNKGKYTSNVESNTHLSTVLQNGSSTSRHLPTLHQQPHQQQHFQISGFPSTATLGVSSSNAALEASKRRQFVREGGCCRCEVCMYRTICDTSFREHILSEEHTQNLIIKDMQHLSEMQQAQAEEPMLFHPGLMMASDAQLCPETAIGNVTYNDAQLMVASQQQQQQQQEQRVMAVASSEFAAEQHLIASGPLDTSWLKPRIDIEEPYPTLWPYEVFVGKVPDINSDYCAVNENTRGDGNCKNSSIPMWEEELFDRPACEFDALHHTCPFCNFTDSCEIELQIHVISKHSRKPNTFACPLCEDTFHLRDALKNHVTDTHQVKKERVNKVMALVENTECLTTRGSSGSSDEQWHEVSKQ